MDNYLNDENLFIKTLVYDCFGESHLIEIYFIELFNNYIMLQDGYVEAVLQTNDINAYLDYFLEMNEYKTIHPFLS